MRGSRTGRVEASGAVRGFSERAAAEEEAVETAPPPRPAVPWKAAFGAGKVFRMVCGQG